MQESRQVTPVCVCTVAKTASKPTLPLRRPTEYIHVSTYIHMPNLFSLACAVVLSVCSLIMHASSVRASVSLSDGNRNNSRWCEQENQARWWRRKGRRIRCCPRCGAEAVEPVGVREELRSLLLPCSRRASGLGGYVHTCVTPPPCARYFFVALTIRGCICRCCSLTNVGRQRGLAFPRQAQTGLRDFGRAVYFCPVSRPSKAG